MFKQVRPSTISLGQLRTYFKSSQFKIKHSLYGEAPIVLQAFGTLRLSYLWFYKVLQDPSPGCPTLVLLDEDAKKPA